MSGNVVAFQTQLVAIMEALVNAVVCETTKLFETGVLQLTVEIADIKKENEELRWRLKGSDATGTAGEAGDSQGSEERKGLHLFKKSYETSASSTGVGCPRRHDGQIARTGEQDHTIHRDSPITSKEEPPGVHSVLIKQEEPDSEEYLPELPTFSEVTPLGQDDLTNELSENSEEIYKHAQDPAMFLCDNGKDLPDDMQATCSAGTERIMGQYVDEWKVLEMGKAKSKHTKELHTSNREKPQHSGKSFSEQVTLLSTEKMCERWFEGNKGDNGVAVQGYSFIWQREPHSDVQYCTYTEEGADCTPLRCLPKSCSSKGPFVGYDCAGPKAAPAAENVNVVVEPASEPDAVKTDGDALGGRECHGHLRPEGQEQPEEFRCTCQVCGWVASSPAALKVHLSVHAGERPYCCGECGKAFLSARGLGAHMQVHSMPRRHQLAHPGDRARTCGRHGDNVGLKSYADVDLRRHEGEAPHGCGVCGKRFRRRRALNTHLLGHAGDKRHVCGQCGKSFLDRGNFKRHRRIHTGEKPYSCQVCGRSFTQSAHLKKHRLTHR